MLIYSLNFLLGINLFSLKNTLEISNIELSVFFALILVIFTLFKRHKTLCLNLAMFLFGFAWMGITSHQIINSQIDDTHLNHPILVKGVIDDLPEISRQKTKFIFRAIQPFEGRLKLSWYGVNRPDLQTGDAWQLQLKLKRNNGYQNTGGFDYEKWLFYKRFDATGYVRSSSFNQLITPNLDSSIDQIRQKIRQALQPSLSDKDFAGVINALIIGDRSLIKDEHWNLFKSTNTTHLSVISGLHIGLISGFVFLLAQFLWRRCKRCALTIPAQVLGAYFGLISAFLYALIAGFSIPTARAFIMASVVFISIIFRRHHNVWQLYGLALMLVLVYNPVSIFSIGFWLSFYVVAVIIYGARQHQNRSWLYRLIYIQLLISIATIPLTAWFFSSGAVLSPIANLIAIPIFSFIVTPLSLIGALFSLNGLIYLGDLSFSIANHALVALSYLLEYLHQFDFNQWHYSQTSPLDLGLFILAIFIAISPKGLKLRRLSIPIIALMLFIPNAKIAKNSVLITTLDVGQGLAHVVQTQNHVLLFDTGASYPSGFNIGESVINPYLRAKRIQHLDRIIISHGDNDHIGGLKSVLEAFSVGKILTSASYKIQPESHACFTGQSWQWDGVLFEIFNPVQTDEFKGNNASCVLKISNNQHSILLTADIEKKTEHRLVREIKDKLKSDILLAPHHGSKTSSTQAFLTAVSPSIVVVSSGYKNRFKHPAETITDRYQANNIKLIKTSCAGQIDITLSDTIKIKEYRQENARYYLRQCK